MSGRDLSKLSGAELRRLATAIDTELERRERERREAERARGGLREGAAPVYRNPENAAETWSGRGPQPHWVSELREKGVRLDSLRIEHDRRKR